MSKEDCFVIGLFAGALLMFFVAIFQIRSNTKRYIKKGRIQHNDKIYNVELDNPPQ